MMIALTRRPAAGRRRTGPGLAHTVARDERGIAMVTVVGVASVLAILVIAGLSFSVGGMTKARNDQNWNAALAAAYAGVEQYMSLLANNDTYYLYGNPDSPFTTPEDPDRVSNVTLPPTENPAFGLGEGGTWAAVRGSGELGTEENAQYRYEVNNSSYQADGTLRVRSTGRAGDATRTIVADLKESGFVDYVMFSDYDQLDPDVFPSWVPSGQNCVRYLWQTSPARPNTSKCGPILYHGAGVYEGNVHTNDRITICGTTFNGRVTTGAPAKTDGTYWDKQSGSCAAPQFLQGPPVGVDKIEIPPTNRELKKEVRFDLDEVENPGCLYTGPTSIVFHADGTMTVKSPWTKATQVGGDPLTGRSEAETYAQCGRAADLASTAGATIPVPNNNVIYIQDVPGLGSDDPNYSADPPASVACTSYTVDGVTQRPNNGLGYPVAGEKQIIPTQAYGCRSGDLFLEGTLSGKVTVTAENYVYITEDVVYNDLTEDILGIIGNSAVFLWNPVDSSKKCLAAYCDTDRTIHGAILSVQHTVAMHNPFDGKNRGTLTHIGSQASKFAGPTAVWYSNTDVRGYPDAVTLYDSRFKFTAPPKYLAPASTTYTVSTWVEVEPAINADGGYR